MWSMDRRKRNMKRKKKSRKRRMKNKNKKEKLMMMMRRKRKRKKKNGMDVCDDERCGKSDDCVSVRRDEEKKNVLDC